MVLIEILLTKTTKPLFEYMQFFLLFSCFKTFVFVQRIRFYWSLTANQNLTFIWHGLCCDFTHVVFMSSISIIYLFVDLYESERPVVFFYLMCSMAIFFVLSRVQLNNVWVWIKKNVCGRLNFSHPVCHTWISTTEGSRYCVSMIIWLDWNLNEYSTITFPLHKYGSKLKCQ